MENLNSIIDRFKTVFTANPNIVFVPVINYNYHSLNPDAATLGLITISNDQLYDIPNKNPYQARTLFATAPSKNYAKGSNIPFSFRTDMYLSNLTETISRIDVDFGNGNGYVQVFLNTIYNASFANSGEVIVKVKFTFSNGTSLYNQFKIYVEVPHSQLPMAYPSLQFPPNPGVHSGGNVSWRLSSNNGTGKILHPLIIVEGFDPMAVLSNKNQTINNLINEISIVGVDSSNYSFLTNLNNSNFDIVYLDYNDGIDDILRNAKLLEEVIGWVNNQKNGVSGAQPNVVMGLSMGGLVAKTALRNMELAGKSHDTRMFISVDSPHKGANVPVGFQAMLRHFEDLNLYIYTPIPIEVYDVSENIDMVANAIKVLNSKAARQMLKYRVVLNNGSLLYDNIEHENFQQQYDNQGFPTQCRNIAVSNGSISGQINFQSGSVLFDFYKKQSLNFWASYFGGMISFFSVLTNYPQFTDIPFITYNSDIILDFTFSSIPNGQIASVYDGRIAVKKKILFVINKELNLSHKSLTSTSDMLPYDGAPGGSYETDFSQVANIDPNYLAMLQDAMKLKKFTFIPTASSLAVNSTYPLDRLDKQNLITNGKTPFVSYFAQHSNEQHTLFTPQNARYILNELSGNYYPTPLGFTVTGPNKFCETGEYTANFLSTSATYNWTKSSNLSIIDGQGTSKAIFGKISPGTSWVKLVITNQSGTANYQNSNISVGVVPPTIIGPFNASNHSAVVAPCIGEPYYFKVYPETIGVTEYRWWLYGGEYPTILSTTSKADFSVMDENAYTITAEQNDPVCGWSEPKTKFFFGTECSGFPNMYSVFPNPVISGNNQITVSELHSDTSKSTSIKDETTKK